MIQYYLLPVFISFDLISNDSILIILSLNENEMDFDLQQVDEETMGAIDSSIEKIKQRDNNTLVNIAGHISFNGTTETECLWKNIN